MDRVRCLIKTPYEVLEFSPTFEDVRQLCGEDPGTNSELIAHFICAWFSLLADSPLNSISLKPSSLYYRFYRQLCDEGLLVSLKRYSSLADSIMHDAYSFGLGSPTGAWIEGMKDTPVFREYLHFYRTGDPVTLKYVLSFLLFGKKLKYDTPKWHETALRGWIENEDYLHGASFDQQSIDYLSMIVDYLTQDYAPSIAYPKFGTGYVAERGLRGDIKKLRYFDMDPQLMAVLLRHLDGDKVHTSLHYSLGTTSMQSKRPSQKPSRLKFVPKDITKSRSICMEPNAVMFTQQAVLRWFREAMDNGVMRQFVDLTDQSRNREAALYGSITGEVDTIDLSSASDLVSWELVKKIFPKNVLFDLALTRTSVVEMPDGTHRRVNKFAPMGSALCFPVQCIIFTACCIYAAMQHSCWVEMHQPTDSDDVNRRMVGFFVETKFSTAYGFIHPSLKLYQPCCVYGDDICIDYRLTDTLITVLTSLKFKVNVNKSFTSSQAFRESCGGYYHQGRDVTPIRYSLSGRKSTLDAEFAAASISLANRAGDTSFFHLRKFVLNSLLREGNQKLPFLFSERDDLPYAFKDMRPINTHLQSVSQCDAQPFGAHNVDYQRREFRCFTFMYKEVERPKESDVMYDSYLYMRWWANRTDATISNPSFLGSSHRVTAGSRLKRTWTAA